MSEMLKKMMEDAYKWREVERYFTDQLSTEAPNSILTAEKDTHLKGYIFDSLMYRYMMARNAQIELDMIKEGIDYKAASKRAIRDEMRFMEILNEAIGEHD